uniref:uncharacterized protein LOC122579372 n=1 Tax=Erigeron canadensis TaxID=72917 RepID=UPI001CB912C7|nr:uncharacterized protein LOC122579372 [Erigeron canadensis]
MNSLSLNPVSTAGNHTTTTKHTLHHHLLHHHFNNNINQKRKTRRGGKCKAVLAHEAPFVVAMGACVLNSLVFPLPVGPDDNEDGESVIESADARFAVMGIISFIPYFNWMSWVFAWMDTMDKRYAVYALVYLAPYLKTKLSLSPEESWLPISSIIWCILHIQLEASIKNGDLPGIPLINRGLKKASSKKDTSISEQETRKDEQNLPSANDEVRDKIRGWGIPKKPSRQADRFDKEDEAEGKKH